MEPRPNTPPPSIPTKPPWLLTPPPTGHSPPHQLEVSPNEKASSLPQDNVSSSHQESAVPAYFTYLRHIMDKPLLSGPLGNVPIQTVSKEVHNATTKSEPLFLDDEEVTSEPELQMVSPFGEGQLMVRSRSSPPALTSPNPTPQ